MSAALQFEQAGLRASFQLYIGGEWVEAGGGGRFASENPATREEWADLADGTTDDIDRAVAAARKAFDEGPWPRMLPQERARYLRRLAELCLERGVHMAQFETADNGKLLSEQTLQWQFLHELMHYWAGMADKIGGRTVQAPMPIDVSGLPIPESFAYTRKEPVGVVGAITPWNSPCFLLAWKFGPAMAAGCTMVCKPSEHAPVSTVEFAKLVDEAGFPPGVFNVVTGASRTVGAHLAAHKDVDKVAFTGSTATGKSIVEAAAGNLKRVTCELGGKSANIIFADADIEKAVAGTMAGIFAAAGQTCMAGSRVLVQDTFHDRFVEALAGAAQSLKLGDPAKLDTQVGPISNRPNFEKVLSFLKSAPEEGASVAAGGRVQEDLGGYFVEPTIFTGVTNDMGVARNEIFGPVASVIKFSSEEEAIAIANDTDYGLGGAVFTETSARAHRVAHQIRTGTVWVNTYRLVSHLVPFGGYRQSGWGRENGPEGIEAYLETKSVWVPLD